MKMKFSYIICVLIIWPDDNCQIHQTILSFQVKKNIDAQYVYFAGNTEVYLIV